MPAIIEGLRAFYVQLPLGEVDARWSRPRLQTLFKFLLSSSDHSAHRDVLIEALWPGVSTDAGRNNLKNAVYHLRRVLEPELDPEHPSRFLVVEGQRYRLVLQGEDRWDASEFLLRAESAHRSQTPEDFAAAAALYGGDYLPDNLYEDWTFPLRERLSTAYTRLLGAWTEMRARSGELERAIEVTERLLAHEPTLESGHRALMQYYLSLGWRDQALRQYRRCETQLRRELEVEPDEETVGLYRSIIAQEGPPGNH